MFHGPREDVIPFFEGLGFRLPPRVGVADFLQEITSRKDQKVIECSVNRKSVTTTTTTKDDCHGCVS